MGSGLHSHNPIYEGLKSQTSCTSIGGDISKWQLSESDFTREESEYSSSFENFWYYSNNL